MLWIAIKAGLGALVSALISRWFGKPKDPEITRLEHELKETRHGEEVFAAPARDKRRVVDAFRLRANASDDADK